jgi:hypothetical protein
MLLLVKPAHGKSRMAEDAGFLSGHTPAFFGAAAALLCASLTMINVVPVAFSGTSVTNVSAHVAELLCELAVHRH